jgi:hypothetical protein
MQTHSYKVYSLSPEERDMALREAYRRQSVNEQNLIKGRNGGAETGDLALFYHKIGAAGEMAVASYLGLKSKVFQEEKPTRGSFDLPGKIDVKTRAKHGYDLIVQVDDNPEKIYWLVTIENKQIRIHGWINHVDCIKDEYMKDPAGGRPAYFVPKERLFLPEAWPQKSN